VQTDAGPRIYGSSEIELAATPEGCYCTHITAEQKDRYLVELRRQEEAGRKRCRELGLEPYLTESERHQARFWKLFRQVCETPAQTTQGFAAKTVFLCDEAEGGSAREELVLSVKADAERLAQT
jgi:hypothetical protein